MTAPRRVAVIGGGTFGAMTAVRLSENGDAVTLYERLPELMCGASTNNQNRLHLGFHYPRDDETARQCVRGFERFRAEFPDCINGGFPNAYFIAREGSRTSPDGFLKFCDRNRLRYDRIDLGGFRPRVDNVALGVTTDEVVYDSALLRQAIMARLQRSGAQVHTGQAVTRLERTPGGGFAVTVGGETHRFDAVVNCSYANINALTSQLGHAIETRQYEYTAVAVIEMDWPGPVGITILDGPFMTVLPFGKTGQFLLYHVEHVVIARDDRPLLDPAWLDPATAPFQHRDREPWFERMRADCICFVPDLERARLVGCLQGPRMVLAQREDTDARPSIVTRHEPGYISVFSGKIDHCVWVADEVLEKLA